MKSAIRRLKSAICWIAATLAVGASLTPGPRPAATPPEANSLSLIVQATDLAGAARAVRSVGGTVTHELGIINAVGARLTAAQVEALRRSPAVRRIYPNSVVRTAGGGGQGIDTFYPRLVGADRLHMEGIVGTGVSVAVVDTGLNGGTAGQDWLAYDINGHWRLGGYDFITETYPYSRQTFDVPYDPYGHGSHVTSVIANSRPYGASYNGIAPNVSVIYDLRSFDGNGSGSYLDVIQGIDFVANYYKKLYPGYRKGFVLNLSFSAPARSHYWDDPLNQAVMRAWQAGIVVVVSAGNTGPDPMTIGVPGNVPYVITVGAMTDHYTPDVPADDYLASFSSTGPTVEGFVKPDVVAPGGHLIGLMSTRSLLSTSHDESRGRGSYFTMSGTSQAAAVVSGIAALMLQKEPSLSPDDVKCRLMAAARPAVDPSGHRAYSVLQQGAGLVDAHAAVYSTASGCANVGLDVNQDLAGTAHYGGPANQNPDGTYYLTGLTGDGYVWNGAYLWSGGYLWSSGSLWADAYLWSGGYLWSDTYAWSSAYLWSGGYLWSASLTETASTNKWVDQQ